MGKNEQQEVVSESAVVGAFNQLLQGVQEIAAGAKAGKQVPFHLAKHKTPWNPEGGPRKVRLKMPSFYQNGVVADEGRLTDREIELINQLKPGVYNSKKWVVRKRKDKSIELLYPNSTVKARMELAREAGSEGLVSMLEKILLEHEAQQKRKRSGDFTEDDE